MTPEEKPVKGMLTEDELARLVETGEIETVLAVFPDFYGRLMGKRFVGSFFLDSVASGGFHACDYLLACDMEMDPVPGYRFTSWEKGYGDFHCLPDGTTLRRAAWLEKTAIVLCDLTTPEGRPIEIAPRQLLARQVERAREMGLVARAGSELEMYVFRETYESARRKGYRGLETFGSYIEDYNILQGTREEPLVGEIVRSLDASGVPMEGSKGEWGPGQQELNVRYSGLLEQADRNVLTKHAAKEIAHAQDLAVTFMAKWNEKLAGNSMHQHFSLWDVAGRENVFAGPKAAGPIPGSEIFRWFLGGWMSRAEELVALAAPSVNSYKRFQSGSFAPTAIAWSRDNRTVGFRVVGEGDSLRIECRIPGADANPYLAYAGALAAGLDGISRRADPPPVFAGDAYAAKSLPRVPRTLRDATDRFASSGFAREAFGGDFVDHYTHFLRTELEKSEKAVTDWEKARYFERG